MKKTLALGIDIGGSHVTAAMVNLETGCLVEGTEHRENLNSLGTAGEILKTWTSCAKRSLKGFESACLAVGMAVPGPFDYEDGICRIQQQSKFRSLYGLELKPVMSEALGIDTERIRFINDAAGFLKGELLGGALRGFSNTMGITLGTGLGSAFSDAEQVTDAGLWQTAFGDSIAEDYLSTGWFVKRYRQLSGLTIIGVKELCGSPGNDSHKEQIFNEFSENLGQFLLEVCGTRPFECVVIGGNIALAAGEFKEKLELKLKSADVGVHFRFAELGEKAALIGAAGMAVRPIPIERNAG